MGGINYIKIGSNLLLYRYYFMLCIGEKKSIELGLEMNKDDNYNVFRVSDQQLAALRDFIDENTKTLSAGSVEPVEG